MACLNKGSSGWTHSKRSRPDSSDDDDDDSDEEVRQCAREAGLDSWPRFLLVESSDESCPLSKLSPFAIQKWFDGISSGFKTIKRLRSGQFLVECLSEKASKLLQSRDGSICVDRSVKVSIHKSLNSCKGVIRCPELEGLSDIEIKSDLQSQGVTDVYRVHITKDGKKVPTNTLFLTFCLPNLPAHISVGYLRVKVTMFTPKPLRCFNCQRFGHGARNCKNQRCCYRCAKDHDTCNNEKCVDTPSCVNCKGNHSSSSKDCPEFLKENEIQQYKVLHRCSFPEARRAVKENVSQSYASVVKQPTGIQESKIPDLNKEIASLVNVISKLSEKVELLEKKVESLTASSRIKPLSAEVCPSKASESSQKTQKMEKEKRKDVSQPASFPPGFLPGTFAAPTKSNTVPSKVSSVGTKSKASLGSNSWSRAGRSPSRKANAPNNNKFAVLSNKMDEC